ncbi:hypothetical protein FZEAL_2509 [Fusarium zealandicum]|uniref:Uncharacterized protein n=1 Tax=Fusarium zealandicum TaxID=1053134 RepID=A0A8H4XNH2_9HYPO|nr:hypothetical protein FZEAL_2509 [Fusarium zealandicum]
MHSRVLLCLAFGLITANSVAASICKPRSSVTSSAESTTSVSSTAETASSTSSETVDVSSSATTTISVTSSEAITSSTETTSTSSAEPIATFSVIAEGSEVSGAVLKGSGRNGDIATFNPAFNARPLIFSIEAATGRARESGGNYLCATYTTQGPAYVAICSDGSEEQNTFLTCEQTADPLDPINPKLACTAPAGSCINDVFVERTCGPTGGTFDQFYTKYYVGGGFYAYIGSGAYPNYQALDFGTRA